MLLIQANFILYQYLLYPVTYLVISDIKSRDLFKFCLLLPEKRRYTLVSSILSFAHEEDS